MLKLESLLEKTPVEILPLFVQPDPNNVSVTMITGNFKHPIDAKVVNVTLDFRTIILQLSNLVFDFVNVVLLELDPHQQAAAHSGHRCD